MTSTETSTPPADVPSARRRYQSLGVLLLAQLLIGVVLGLVWLKWSPHSVAYNIDLGNGQGVIIPGEGESLVAADGRFAVLTAVAGVAFGFLVWRQRDLRGRVSLTALAVSSLLASVLTKYTGQLLSGGHRTAAINTAFRPHLTLHANVALLLQALLAALVYTMFVGLTGDPKLGRPEVFTEVSPELTGYHPPSPDYPQANGQPLLNYPPPSGPPAAQQPPA